MLPVRNTVVEVLLIACLLALLPSAKPGSSSLGKCKVNDRLNLALEAVEAPSRVLAEYSDVESATACFMKCCDANSGW